MSRRNVARNAHKAVAKNWQNILARGGIVVLDGGTGTELRRRGVPLTPTRWSALASLSHYEELRAYSRGLHRRGRRRDHDEHVRRRALRARSGGIRRAVRLINARAVAAAREARDESGRDVAIAGSISCLPPRFDVTRIRTRPSTPRITSSRIRCSKPASTFLLSRCCKTLDMLRSRAKRRAASAAVLARRQLPTRQAGKTLVASTFRLVRRDASTRCCRSRPPWSGMHSPVEAVVPALARFAPVGRGFVGAYPEGDGSTRVRRPPRPARGDPAIGGKRGAILGGCCGTDPTPSARCATSCGQRDRVVVVRHVVAALHRGARRDRASTSASDSDTAPSRRAASRNARSTDRSRCRRSSSRRRGTRPRRAARRARRRCAASRRRSADRRTRDLPGLKCSEVMRLPEDRARRSLIWNISHSHRLPRGRAAARSKRARLLGEVDEDRARLQERDARSRGRRSPGSSGSG